MFIEVKDVYKQTLLLNLSRVSCILPWSDPGEDDFHRTGIVVYYEQYDTAKIEDYDTLKSDVFYGVTYEDVLRILKENKLV